MSRALTFAEARQRKAERGLIVAPERSTAPIQTGDAALFIHDWRAYRVLVASPERDDAETGERVRTCVFVDQDNEEFDVRAAALEPCDAEWRPMGQPAVLQPGARRWDIPYTPKPVQRAPVMDKFDRVAPVRPKSVQLHVGNLSPDQVKELQAADEAQASAETRKDERSIISKDGEILGYGRMTTDEFNERRQAREIYGKLQRDTAAANDRGEVNRGRSELLALEARRGGEFIDREHTICRKNGLDTLRQAGTLTIAEHAAGEKYAEVFSDALDGELRTAAWMPGGGGNVNDPEAERLQRLRELKAKERLTFLHALVQARVKSPRAVMTLRLVAGQGRLASHLWKGATKAKHVEALQRALEVLADLWGLQ